MPVLGEAELTDKKKGVTVADLLSKARKAVFPVLTKKEMEDFARLPPEQRMGKAAEEATGLVNPLGMVMGMGARRFTPKKPYYSGLWDKKMRWKISDKDMKINQDTIHGAWSQHKQYGVSKKLTLSDVIDHPELFENYPDLKKMPVKVFESQGNVKGTLYGEPREGTAYVELLYGGKPDKGRLKNDMVHEVQHWIQDWEGMARGGNTASYRGWGGMIRRVQDAPKKVDDLMQADQKYRNAVDKFNKRVEGKVYKSGSKDVAEVNKARIDFIEDPDVFKYIKMDEMKEPYEFYKRLAGEVESRESSTLSELPLSDLVKVQPMSTEGIKLEDLITKGVR